MRPRNSPGPKSSRAHPSPIQTSPLHHQYETQQQSVCGGSLTYPYSSFHQQQLDATTNTPTSMLHPNGGPMMSVTSNPEHYYSSSSVEDHAGAGSPIATAARSRSASQGRTITHRARSNSLVSDFDNNADWEDMQEVHEDCDDNVPTSEYFNAYDHYMQQQQYYDQQQRFQTYSANSPSTAYSGCPHPQTSSFASSDPFYLATAAAAAPTSTLSQPPTTFAPASNVGAASTRGTSWFAPPVGFAAYVPAGNRWPSNAATASALQ